MKPKDRCMKLTSAVGVSLLWVSASGLAAAPEVKRNVYFGDLHVHTAYSFDAAIFGVATTPDDAYRFAKGEAIKHAAGHMIRHAGPPLDFLAVTDHAEYLGVLDRIRDPEHELSQRPLAKKLLSVVQDIQLAAFYRVGNSMANGEPISELNDPAVQRTAWDATIAAANAHYDPGRFTSFVGYEYTSAPPVPGIEQGEGDLAAVQNMHRNLIFRGETYPAQPFSALASRNPEDLWRWMDLQRRRGIESLAIPHNSNLSNGLMFATTTYEGRPIDAAYARLRLANEPLAEISQIKGTSETHPSLSSTDEWADFEIYGKLMGRARLDGQISGSYVRQALVSGLQIAEQTGINPYKLGIVASSDTHNSASPVEEFNYFGKIGRIDPTPESRGSIADKPIARNRWSAAGLTGVWANRNDRRSLFDSLRSKEVFGTSGPRISLRFFGGEKIGPAVVNAKDAVVSAYAYGVPMGGSIAGARSMSFYVHAMRDSQSAWLDRIQIIKLSLVAGRYSESVYDVACSDGRAADRITHRCPMLKAEVNMRTCQPSNAAGSVELKTVWRDPGFVRNHNAVYYARVLEMPTCRWSSWDAAREGTESRPELPTLIQERAWSSPIWYGDAS